MTRGGLEPCFGCGALVCGGGGNPHPYIGASEGCWEVYSEILGREYGPYGYPECHRLTVDTYAVQHPGTPSRRSIQSVAVHLISLHLILERGLSAGDATEAIRGSLKDASRFDWLDPPSFAGTLTVLDVHRTANLESHSAGVRRWAESVWEAWRDYHGTVAAWIGSSGRASRGRAERLR